MEKEMKQTAPYAGALAAVFVVAGWAALSAPGTQQAAHPKMTVAAGAQGAHNATAAVSANAARKGQYNCCIRPACNFCALHMAMCPCGKNLAKSQAVCRECKGGWHAGEGALAGIKPENVKVISAAEAMKMMKSKMDGGKMHKSPAPAKKPAASGHKEHHP
jgi:hypothetical protein